jgi:predicted dehydrogenase
MSTLHAASQAVLQAIHDRRIGSVLSVRLVAHTIADHGQIHDSLAEALDATCQWLDASPSRLSARGAAEAGQISALLQFPAGQTALVSVGTRGNVAPTLEVVVVGAEGILAWEPDDAACWEKAQADPPTVSERGRELLHAVEASLQSGRAVAVGRGTSADSEQPPVRDELPQSDLPTLQPGAQVGSAAQPPFGVLLVAGAHTHQENYARALAADPRCRLVGVTDEPDVSPRRAALNEQLAHALDIPLIARLDDALGRDDVHIVSICAEPARRGRIILQCARAGKHLYLDKPLAAGVDEADAIVRAVQEAGVVSQMFSLVHTGPARRARQAVESGMLGRVVAVHCDLFFAKGPSGTANLGKPRIESKRPTTFELVESKRELFNVGVYPLVLIHWLLGRAVRSVFAATANYFFREHQQNDMEDYAQLLMELDGEVTATIAVGRTGWRSSPMGGVNRAYLVGTKGTAVIDAYRPRLAVWANEPPWQPPPRHPDDPMGMWSSTQQETSTAPKQPWIVPGGTDNGDACHFLDCVEQRRRSDVSALDGALVVETLMAAYASAASGQVVRLPLPRA